MKKEKTILLTTHYLEEADSLADHIAIMDNGKIIESGTSSELKKRHAGKQILTISAENITSEIIDILSKQDLETNIIQNGIEIKAQKLDVDSIIDILKQNKVKINGMQTQEPTLEDVFLQLTGKEAMQ